MENQIVTAFLALGLLASLYLTLQVKMDMSSTERNWRKEIEQMRFQLNEQRSNWIQSVRKEDDYLVPKVPLLAEVAFPLRVTAATSSSTLWGDGTKAKAIEMVKRGETSTKISEALSLPKPEVEFLMKLERSAAKN